MLRLNVAPLFDLMAERYERWLRWEKHLGSVTPPHFSFSAADAQAFLTAMHFVSAKEIYDADSNADKILDRLNEIWTGLDAYTNYPSCSALEFYGADDKVHKRVRANIQSVLVRTERPTQLDVLLPIDILRHVLLQAGRDWLFVDPGNGWVFFDEPDFKDLAAANSLSKQDMIALPHWLIDNNDLNYSGCMWDVYRKLAVLVFDLRYLHEYRAHLTKVRRNLRLSWNQRRTLELALS